MVIQRRGFVLAEAVALILVVAVVAAILLPMAHRRHQWSSLDQSRNNVRAIVAAQWSYRDDAADQPPMRGNRYTNGQISSGWDTWAFGGKNCDIFWQTGLSGAFDESAYARPLNAYLTSEKIPVPAGYQNTGAGPTWNFRTGTPTPQQRLSLEIPVFRSPGDTSSRQRTWPNPSSAISNYNDVGTSYHVNMAWWSQAGLPPGSFTARFDEGVRRIKEQGHIIEPQMYVWISDEVGNTVPELQGVTIPGQFGGVNKSVLGFLDGRAEYMQLTAGGMSGKGYRFFLH